MSEELSAVELGGINVYYRDDLDGGGRTFGQEYVEYVARRFDHVGRVYEWCSGPAFIGFSLLGHGLCDSLCLADVNPDAIAAIRRTISENNLQNVISIYDSDNLKGIPREEAWDLVVGNPPHYKSMRAIRMSRMFIPFVYSPAYLWRRMTQRRHISIFGGKVLPLCQVDRNWSLHREFYGRVASHLSPSGIVALQENRLASSPKTFRTMIRNGGLKIQHTQRCKIYPAYYFLECSRTDA